MNISAFGNSIFFYFNSPEKEADYLSETFDLNKKRAYATSGIQEFLRFKNKLILKVILGTIFGALSKTAKLQKVDYLQNIVINGVDDGA